MGKTYTRLQVQSWHVQVRLKAQALVGLLQQGPASHQAHAALSLATRILGQCEAQVRPTAHDLASAVWCPVGCSVYDADATHSVLVLAVATHQLHAVHGPGRCLEQAVENSGACQVRYRSLSGP